MLAGGYRGTRALRPTAGGTGVEIDRDLGVGETRVPVGGPFEAAICRGEGGQLCRVAAEQDRLGDEAVAAAEHQPAFTSDRHQ